MVFAFVPPAVIELGTSNGFSVQLQDRSGLGHDAWWRHATSSWAWRGGQAAGRRAPEWSGRHARVQLDIDHAKAGALGVSVATSTTRCPRPGAAITSTTSSTAGESRRSICRARRCAHDAGGPRQVVRAQRQRRNGAVLGLRHGHWGFGSPLLERFNGQPSIEMLGQAAPGSQLGRRDERQSGDSSPNCHRASASNGRALSYEERRPERRRRRCTPCRCWWCFCAWRRFTRAGRFRLR
jgi:multidrug efflux pump